MGIWGRPKEKRVKDYVIASVSAGGINPRRELQDKVDSYIKEGYEPVGGPIIFERELWQAMVSFGDE